MRIEKALAHDLPDLPNTCPVGIVRTGSLIMPIERWSEDVMVVHLSDDPQFTDDLEALDNPSLPKRMRMVLDFATVHFINSSNLAKLLRLRKQTILNSGRLILCNISTQVWGTFLVTGLDKVFELSDNVPTSLATLQMA